MSFPDNFIFGTATSAFQIEGEGETEWSGFIGADGTKLGLAINHYNRYKEDLEYILYLGNAYRFSMDWSKLQKGPFFPLDNDALRHYEEIFKKLKENNKKILLVLHHFSNPLWLSKIGGWTNKKSVEIYFDYVKKVLKAYSDYIDIVNTFNEPNAYVNMTYLLKGFPPKKINPILRNMALSNMANVHGVLYDYIKEKYPEIMVGISHAHMIVEVMDKKNIAANFIKNFFDFIEHEHVHEYFTKKGTSVDYIGFSYYGRIPVDRYPLLAYEERGRKKLDELGRGHDDMWELYPEGIYKQIKFFYEKYKKPILITENGTCTDDDELRKHSLYNHLFYIKKACDEGVPVLGYFHWSTFDNFELAHGPSRRFGLTSVDFKSPGLIRKIKPSGHYYHKIVEVNKLIEIS
ncbi:MAG: glycoside hydrolase family 1 protein [Actinobacteria bacterium]|nr:glycoside hydrolase family 1 protein [Actinomycetota bacterium]MBM3713473.1 glycoside hydrolase family 1 protein [Actinomycetota bacterium]